MVLQPLIKKYEILLHVGDPSYRDALAQFDLGFVMAEDLEKARELADKTVLEPKHLLATFNEFAQEAGHPPADQIKLEDDRFFGYTFDDIAVYTVSVQFLVDEY